MSSMDLKDVLIAMLPQGALWDLDEEGDLYKTLVGVGANHTPVYEYTKQLALIREPKETPILSDLEKEYGLLVNASLTEQERRDYLHGVAYAPRSTGAWEYLQSQLQAAGFNVQVHVNSPAVDPTIFYGGAGGEMVTNNVFYDRTILNALKDPNLWGYIFFVGGDAIRGSDGALLAIVPIVISDSLKALFRELILKYKPLHSWGMAVINDAGYFTFATGDEAEVDAVHGFADDAQITGGYWWTHNLSDIYIYDDVTLEYIIDEITGEYLLEV